MKFTKVFTQFATKTSRFAGRSWAFALAVGIVIGWIPSILVVGSIDTWQLLINTLTTIVTFLLVVLLQNSTNRDFMAVQIKLDMILHALKIDNKKLLELEDMSDTELEKMQQEIQKGKGINFTK